MTNRIEKVNSLLEHEIGKIIQREIVFPKDFLVTLTKVQATPNLIEAKVYISVYPEDKADYAIEVLNKSVYDIQHQINRKLNMRPIPKIIFVKDVIESKAGKVEELLARLKKDGK